MKPWKRKGDKVIAEMDKQEAAVLRGLVTQIDSLLKARAAQAPQDELAELTGIRTGSATAPDDPILARLLPDFHRLDSDTGQGAAAKDSAAALRSLHEPAVLDHKAGAATTVLDTCPLYGGQVRLTIEQADQWLSAINDIRLAVGTAIEVTEESPDELPDDDPRGPHLAVYHWLTWMQDSLVQALSPE